MAVLETLVRRLAAAAAAPAAPPPVSTGPAAATAGVPPGISPPAATPAATSPAATPPAVPRPLEAPVGSQAPIDPTVRPSPTAAAPEPTPSSAGRQPPRGRPAASPRPSRPSAAGMVSSLSERWIGQRVFLGIGVVALLMAAGYLLKLSFERGWISPVLRCAGGVAAGLGVGALGWRLEPRYRTYGAALVGAGAGIIYLSIWAATRLYEVLPPASGIVGLALVSVGLAMIAYAINVEALGVTAALGAFFAPVLLGRNAANADLLLLYLASMAAG